MSLRSECKGMVNRNEHRSSIGFRSFDRHSFGQFTYPRHVEPSLLVPLPLSLNYTR